MKGHLKIVKRLVGLGFDVNEANRVRMLFIVSNNTVWLVTSMAVSYANINRY